MIRAWLACALVVLGCTVSGCTAPDEPLARVPIADTAPVEVVPPENAPTEVAPSEAAPTQVAPSAPAPFRAEPQLARAEVAPSILAPAHGHAAPSSAAPTGSPSRAFGAPIDESLALTPLSAIVAEPESYRDRVVRTEGEIAQVCQRMGCWMELRERAGGPSVRVPMAGHRFFLPRDVAGRRATMEGRVVLAALSDAMRAHLTSEGATLTSSALSIHASGVVVH